MCVFRSSEIGLPPIYGVPASIAWESLYLACTAPVALSLWVTRNNQNIANTVPQARASADSNTITSAHAIKANQKAVSTNGSTRSNSRTRTFTSSGATNTAVGDSANQTLSSFVDDSTLSSPLVMHHRLFVSPGGPKYMANPIGTGSSKPRPHSRSKRGVNAKGRGYGASKAGQSGKAQGANQRQCEFKGGSLFPSLKMGRSSLHSLCSLYIYIPLPISIIVPKSTPNHGNGRYSHALQKEVSNFSQWLSMLCPFLHFGATAFLVKGGYLRVECWSAPLQSHAVPNLDCLNLIENTDRPVLVRQLKEAYSMRQRIDVIVEDAQLLGNVYLDAEETEKIKEILMRPRTLSGQDVAASLISPTSPPPSPPSTLN